nr:MAG: hypothetical protein [Bacteriophage sp.]
MDIEINEVQEIIKNIESKGEVSIKEEKYLKVAKLCVQLAAENSYLMHRIEWPKQQCPTTGDVTDVEPADFIPATDRIVAGIKADGVEEFAAYCGEENSVFVEAKAYYRSLPDAAYEFAKQLREGADK